MCKYKVNLQNRTLVKALNELHSTATGYSLQCDKTCRIILHFGTIEASFRIQDLLTFGRFLNGIDIRSKIFDLSDSSDYEYIESPQQNISQKLMLCEFIQLRDLVNGTHFAIELNSMLHTILYQERELV